MENKVTTVGSDKFFNVKEAAEYLGLAPQTLYNWSVKCKGPTYVRFGTAKRYRKADLDAFAEKCTIHLN